MNGWLVSILSYRRHGSGDAFIGNFKHGFDGFVLTV